MYHVKDRANAQLEVCILGSYLRAPTTGAMEALRSVTRYLLGAQGSCVNLRIQSADPVSLELVGYSDSDWAGDPSSRRSMWKLTKTKLCGDEQRNGGVLRNVLDCPRTAAFWNTLDSEWTRPCFAILWLRGALRNVPDRRKELAVKT